jgi:hypothetical protein
VERVLSVAFIREFESPTPFYDPARAELNGSTSQLVQAMASFGGGAFGPTEKTYFVMSITASM